MPVADQEAGNGAAVSVDYLCLQVSHQGQASFAHVHEIIEGLRKRGCTVQLHEPAIGMRAPKTIKEKLWSFASVQLKLWREARHSDAIYIRAHPLAIPTMVWAKLHRIPVVSELNSTYEDIFSLYPWTRPLKPLIHLIGHGTLVLSGAVITVSEGLRQWVLEKVPTTSVHVIPNGANVDVFRPVRGKGCVDSAPYILFFGAMSPWQGILTLLDATSRPEWPEGIKLVFAGDGVLKQTVEEFSEKNSRVQYIGRIPYTELANVIGDSLAAVSTQTGTQDGDRNETKRTELRAHFSPLKMYETLACGVPMIVSDFPGQAELIRTHDCGIVVPPADAAAIAQAVRAIAENTKSAREMGERGRSAVTRAHSWQHRADETLKVLREVVQKNV